MVAHRSQLRWLSVLLLFITSINGFGSPSASASHASVSLAAGNSYGRNGTSPSTEALARARKIVADAQKKMKVANKARVDNPKRNNYSLKPGSLSGRRADAAAAAFIVTDEIAAAAALVAEADAAAELKNGTLQTDYSFAETLGLKYGNERRDKAKRDGDYWMGKLDNLGTQPFGGDSSYKVFRDVKVYGAKGDGLSDDTEAINKAISDGNRCGANCYGSSVKSAVVYFPPGIYLVSKPIVSYFHTNIIGDPTSLPIIKAAGSFSGLGVITTDVYYPEGGTGIDGNSREWYINTANFYRQIRNFVIDIRSTPEDAYVAALHYQVAQATSLSRITFLCSTKSGTTQQAIFAENGSGGFISDLTFYGGNFGIYGGSQQFTASRLTFISCVTAVQLVWDWGWIWREIAITGAKTGFKLISEDGVHHTGSLLLQDSSISNTDTAILIFQPVAAKLKGTTGITIDNCEFTSVKSVVADTNGKAWVDGSVTKIDTYTLGPIFSQSSKGDYSLGAQSKTPRVEGLTTGGGSKPKQSYFSRRRPDYVGAKVVQMKWHAKGDGKTDDTAAFQQVINDNAGTGNVVFVDGGSYILTDTIHIPSGTKIVGQAWSQLVASGPKFQDETKPHVLFRVGNEGEKGNAEIQDLLFTTKGPTAGLLAVEWNMEADAQGSAAMWDCHVRIGGAKGTDLDVADCPVSGINRKCMAGAMMFHMTKSASAYIENMWLWVADHGLDDDNMTQLSVYVARGMLIESTKPVWLYGTATEHAVFYQYEFLHAKNVLAAMIQTESAYFQPKPLPPAPFDASVGAFSGDPSYENCSSDRVGCDESWAVVMESSSDITIAGAGLYSWFQNYAQTCVDSQNCQKALVYLKDNHDGVRIWNIITIGALKMIVSEADGSTFEISALDYTHVDYHPYWSQISSFEPPAKEDDGEGDDDLIYVPTGVWTAGGAPSASCIPPCTLVLPPLQLGSTTTISWPDLTTTLLSSAADGKIETITTTITVKAITTTEIAYSPVTVGKDDPTTGSFTPLQSVVPSPFTVKLPSGVATFPPTHIPPYSGGTPVSTSSSSTILPPFFPGPHGYTIQPQPTVWVTVDKTYTYPIIIPSTTIVSGESTITIPPTTTTTTTTDPIIFWTSAKPKETCKSNCGKYDCKFGCGKKCGEFGCDGGCGVNGCGGHCGLFGCGSKCLPFIGCDPGAECPLSKCGGLGCAAGGCGNPDENCEKNEAQRCTHIVSSTLTAEPNHYSTTTRTRCATYASCHATDTTTTRTQTEPDQEWPTVTISLHDERINEIPAARATSIASDILNAQASWNKIRFGDDGTHGGGQACPSTTNTGYDPGPTITSLDGEKHCFKCDNPTNPKGFNKVGGDELDQAIRKFCNGATLRAGQYEYISANIPISDVYGINFSVSRKSGAGCKPNRALTLDGDYCVRALKAIGPTCDDDSEGGYGGYYNHNGDYGCIAWDWGSELNGISASVNYHTDCTGDMTQHWVLARDDGLCVNTDCKAGSIRTDELEMCPGGQLQISYWQNPGCSGDWYGYGYMGAKSCHGLWTDGYKFKSLHLRCARKEDDCVTKGTCTYAPEPANNIC